MMNKNVIKKLKEKLVQQKKELEEQLKNIADKDEEVKDNYQTRFPDYGREDQDNAEEVSDFDRSLPIEHQLELELQKINNAIKKIEQGKNFGKCENCGKDIDSGRLKARPQAQLCKLCAEK